MNPIKAAVRALRIEPPKEGRKAEKRGARLPVEAN
jgi:hypothetical protein